MFLNRTYLALFYQRPYQLLCLLVIVLSISFFVGRAGVSADDNNVDSQIDNEPSMVMQMGDVTCDEKLNAVDALAIIQYDIGMRDEANECPLPSAGGHLDMRQGDVNADGSVGSVDALMVLQCDIGMDNMLCPEDTTPSVFRVAGRLSRNEAIEATGEQAQLLVRRSEGTVPVTVRYVVEWTADPERTAAGPEDVILRDENGLVLDGTISFALNQMDHRVTIEAVVDENIEVPEQFTIRLEESSGYTLNPNASSKALIVRDDTPGITEESRLFVGLMAPEGDAVTSASGIAIIRLSRDNSYGLVDYTFSGLTDVQTAAHIHYANPLSGPIIFGLPLGQVVDERWDIEGAALAATDQRMLDALLAGQLYINAHSVTYPAGEIRGNTVLSNGAPEMAQPLPPAPIEPLTGDNLQRDVVRFLTQATFGPTPETVADMMARIDANDGDRIAAYEQWMDEQMTLVSPSLRIYANAHNRHYHRFNRAVRRDPTTNVVGVTEGWFTGAVYSKAQLRERIGFALSEIFVVSMQNENLRQNPWGITSYYDTLRVGAFGRYRNLIEDISLHPAMGWYLSHFQNQAEQMGPDGELLSSPDENYAREIMQLFSIGLVDLHPDGSLMLDEAGLPTRTYTQEDIVEMARVFTGWAFAVQNDNDGVAAARIPNLDFFYNGHEWSETNNHHSWLTPMKMFENNDLPEDDPAFVRYHDNGEKVVLGNVFPAGQSGEEDLEQALDILSSYPSTAPFISYRLIQRLVMSNPPAGYIYRVATTFQESGGNLGAVVKAILLDPEARNLSHIESVGYGKKKEPLVQAVAALRAVRAHSQLVEFHNTLDGLNLYSLSAAQMARYEEYSSLLFLDWENFGEGMSSIGQSPLNAPSVFNWFGPSYSVAGAISEAGLVAPEFEQITDNRLVQIFDFYHNFFIDSGVWGSRSVHETLDKSTVVRTTYTQPSWLVDPYMAVMDSDGDGDIDAQDENFSDPAAVRTATAAMLDAADLYLCGGVLKANATGDPATDPYEIILDGLMAAYDYRDHVGINASRLGRDGRIEMALYLMGSAPQCAIQR